MIRNSLYLFLVLMLIVTPVDQAAHALTHISDIDVQNLITQIDDDHDHDHEELNVDIDKICPDCIALTGFNDFAATLDFSFHPEVIRHQLSSFIFRFIPEDFSSNYYPRAPPLV